MRGTKAYLGLGFDDVNVIALIVVVQADAVALGEAGVAAQRCLQHRLWVADVEEVLARTAGAGYGDSAILGLFGVTRAACSKHLTCPCHTPAQVQVSQAMNLKAGCQ